MKILLKKTILYYTEKYPKAAIQLLIWQSEFSKYNFNNFNELKSVYKNASIVNSERVIFNIKGNEYRLIVSLNFSQKACYIIWFGTHAEYDKVKADKIEFDKSIIN